MNCSLRRWLSFTLINTIFYDFLSGTYVPGSSDGQIIYTRCRCYCTVCLLGLLRPWGTDLVLNLLYRNKTGILGWRSEKTETVNGYEAKVEHRRHRQLTDLSHCPEKPPLSELNLIFPESPLHLKSFISRMNHSQSYFKTFALDI